MKKQKTKNNTFKNKIYALLLVILGDVSVLLLKDITFLIIMLIIAIPIFFSKENWIM